MPKSTCAIILLALIVTTCQPIGTESANWTVAPATQLPVVKSDYPLPFALYPALTPEPISVNPYPALLRTLETTERAYLHETRVSQATLSPDEMATFIARFKESADITLNSNGQTFTYTLTTRFSVFLDDENYPVTDLDCVPSPVIGAIPNGSHRGPYLYPITYEGFQVGKCQLRNRDFAVTIIITSLPTEPYTSAPPPEISKIPHS